MDEQYKATDFKDIGTLLFRSPTAVKVVNIITIYRIVTFPLLVILAFSGNIDTFKWLLLASFFTDAIDGFLARHYNATSILGAKLDSIGDDLTVLAAVIGLFLTQSDFVKEQLLIISILLGLLLVQMGLAFYRYGKISTFHTYLAKTAAVIAALFLLSVFFFDGISYLLFYAAAAVTALELVEEIILVWILRDYRSNVKGLYWLLKGRRQD